jgi:hypothetical protein
MSKGATAPVNVKIRSNPGLSDAAINDDVRGL